MRIACLITAIMIVAQFRAPSTIFAATTEPAIVAPDTIRDDPAVLVQIKKSLAAGAGPAEAVAQLKRSADRLLTRKPASVMDKPKPGPSGDKHDYVSYGPYWWPNPNTPDGLPFIRRDGDRNSKQVALGEAPAYESLLSNIHTLGLAYWYTGNDAYAKQAALLARTWFLDPATRMNPNFQYAQATLGSTDGRGIGLIEDRGIVGMLDGLTLIKTSPAWTNADDAAMHEWIEKFNTWITTSKEGLDEKAATNNHGSWYTVQAVGLALYLHNTKDAQQDLEGIKDRITKQIEPDGRQPLETARADGFSYSCFNLSALVVLADIGQRQGVDLWKFDKDHRSMKSAIDYLMPFASGQKPWPTTQGKKITPDSLAPIVTRASQVYDDPSYKQWLAAEHIAENTGTDVLTGDFGG